jgi:hypothetical protein
MAVYGTPRKTTSLPAALAGRVSPRYTPSNCFPGRLTMTNAKPLSYYNSTNAQATLTVNPGSLISQTGWSVTVDSQETSCYNGAGTNAIYGNSSTMWHTQFCPTNVPGPHQMQINLGASHNLTGFQYLPRQDGCANGWIKQYEFYVSADGVTWPTTPNASGTFNYGNLSTTCPGGGVPSGIQIAFPPAVGQYIRLRELSEINGNPWTSAAEINVLGQ